MATNGARTTAAAHARGMETRCRVVVADDDVLLREGVASLLERTGFEVVGRAGDGAELIELVRRLKPELVLVDIRMPPTHSVEGLEAARARAPRLGWLPAGWPSGPLLPRPVPAFP